MDELPVILAVGINDSKPEYLIKSILESDGQSNSESIEDPSSYCWEISNKYYSAKVHFEVCSLADVNVSNLSSLIEAVIIYFDFVSETFLNQLNQLNNTLKNTKPAVQLIVCSSEVSESHKNCVEDWCIRNKYELVELKPKIDAEDCETDFEECYGIDRVKEILSSHQWPNLVMKGKSSNAISESFSLLQNLEILENGTKSCEDGPSDYPNDEFELEESLNDMEQLSTLFKDLQTMKQDISSLPTDEKFKQAEKVVKTFWRAMHGDSDEFSESDDET
ncbi:hypothetical protein V9T40_006853 [Parthenolecanium corni]|uniref:Alpha-and gamma-adaptin-binding protein p34 n=1 Tax=Parthenolecanium corni TaxID=536013 RepID=A0AAN9U0G5_9HEMI